MFLPPPLHLFFDMIYRALLMGQGGGIPEPLIHYDFSLYTNQDHPSTIPDLTGNGYGLTPHNIDFKLKRGFGGYVTDFTDTTVYYTSNAEATPDTLEYVCNSQRWLVASRARENAFPPYLIKVSGITPGSVGIEYIYTDSDYNSRSNIKIVQDGIYLLPESPLFTGDSEPTPVVGLYNRSSTNGDKITIEQLPLYPGCFVLENTGEFNSVPICALKSIKNNQLSSQTGITVIVKRSPKLINLDSKFIADNTNREILVNLGNFCMEMTYGITDSGFIYRRNNIFGQYNVLDSNRFSDNNISYITSKSYNGIPQTNGGLQNNNPIIIGNIGPGYQFNNAISEIYIWDKDLTQSQIERFISENMVPDPLVYYDVRKQNTKNTDTANRGRLLDLSGNGNHGTLNNFGYTEDSGWVETYIDDTFPIIEDDNLSYENHLITTTTTTITNSTFFRSSVLASGGDKEKAETGFQMKSYRIKVSGLGTGSFRIGYFYRIYRPLITISSDGIYEIPSWINQIYEPDYSLIPIYAMVNSEIPVGCTVEFLPQTDYIQFDGVDDHISIPKITEGFKTVLMVGENTDSLISNASNWYSQRTNLVGKTFGIHDYLNEIAYQGSNSGDTFVNGLKNNSLTCSQLRNHCICICQINSEVNSDNSGSPVIGCEFNLTGFCHLRLHKFLGFHEYLSETQIRKVIEKYGLREGTDNVEIQ